jgi:probable F420-dependent oxidoreductase
VLIDLNHGVPPEDMSRQARAAERSGYDGVWIGETNADPFLKALQAAQGSDKLMIGTGVAIALARTPMLLAYTGYDLARASGGRFVLGIGSQVKAHIERRFSMPWSNPAPRMREFVLAMRAIWASWCDGSPLNFAGEYYQHTLMTPFFRPDPHAFGPPPVYLGGVGEGMTAVAGEVGDGFLFHPFTTPRYLEEVTLPALRRGRARAARTDLEDFVVSGPVFACVGRNEEELAAAIRATKNQIAFYASTPAYRTVLELHGWHELQTELRRWITAGRWNRLGELIDDEIFTAFAVHGGVAEVAAVLQQRWGTLVNRISLYTPYAVDPATLESLVASLRQSVHAR